MIGSTPAPSRTIFQCLPSTSAIGSFTVRFCASTRFMSSDSSSFRRITMPTMTSTAESRNGARQPQRMKSEAGRALRAKNARVASRLPVGEPCWAKAAYRMPLPLGALSLAIRIAPPHSPPTAMPWTIRSATREIGAQMPICV